MKVTTVAASLLVAAGISLGALADEGGAGSSDPEYIFTHVFACSGCDVGNPNDPFVSSVLNPSGMDPGDRVKVDDVLTDASVT